MRELVELIGEGRASLLGPVRQEILSGVKEPVQFERLRKHLRAFPDLALATEDHEEAARAFNRCRARGIQGSNTDFLMCAVAVRCRMAIFTTDRDFRQYAQHIPVVLHDPRA